MKYYSEELKKFYNTESELIEAEKESACLKERAESTKKELEKAVKDKVDTIIVTGELTKKVAILKKIYKLGRKKIIVLTSAISGACAAMISTAVIAASAAPSTGGASLIIAGFVEAGEAATAATATGTSVAVIVALVSACAFLG